MDSIKMSVTFVIPGRQLMTPQTCGENVSCDTHVVKVSIPVKKGKKTVMGTEVIKYKTRRCIPATQVINMCDEAYEEMITTPSFKCKPAEWKKMSIKERLERNLDVLKQYYRAYKYEYKVFED